MAARAIARQNLTVESLREHLHYDPETGVFRRLKGREQDLKRANVGSINRYGYRLIKLNGETFSASWLAWFFVTGDWPKQQIDHINGDRADDRFKNLREATLQENLRNRGSHKRNTSGFKGVCWNKQARKWQASIGVNGRLKHLGLHDSAEKAHEAYCLAAHFLHGDFANRGDFSS